MQYDPPQPESTTPEPLASPLTNENKPPLPQPIETASSDDSDSSGASELTPDNSNSTDNSISSFDEKVQQIKGILPHLSEKEIEDALRFCNFNVDEAMNSLLST